MTKWQGLVALTVGAVLTACSSGGLHPIATTSAAASRLDRLADCSSIQPTVFDPDPDPALDCVLRSADSSKDVFEVLGTPAETVKVFDANGTLRQTITQKVDKPQRNTPFLADLDRDGRDELVVVTSAGGNGGVGMAVWRANRESNQFTLAGEVFGFPDFRSTDEKFTAFYSHSGAGSGSLTVYRFVADKLVKLAILQVQTLDWPDPDPAPAWYVNGNTKCALYPGDDPPGSAAARRQALADAGIDPATAQDHFCSQAWVGTIYRQR